MITNKKAEKKLTKLILERRMREDLVRLSIIANIAGEIYSDPLRKDFNAILDKWYIKAQNLMKIEK